MVLTMSQKFQYIPVFTLICVVLLLNLFSIRYKTCVRDERAHYLYGSKILAGNPDRAMGLFSTMPFTSINVLPTSITKILNPLNKSKQFSNIISGWHSGRCVTMLFSLLLALYVYRWTKELYGYPAAIFSMFLYTFSPNMIAHSRLITTDLYAACLITIATYYFWKFVNNGGWRRGVISAVTLGISQLAKYTSLFLYPIFFLILIIKYRNARGTNLVKPLLKYGVLFFSLSLIIINAGFLFDRCCTPLGDYKFESDLFRSTQSNLIRLKNVPLFIPYSFIEGLDHLRYYAYESLRRGRILVYLRGELRQGAFKGYYLWTLLYKLPIAIQIFLFLAIIYYFKNKRKYKFFDNELFLAVPVLFFSVYFTFFHKCQIGIRHFLVSFPFIYIFCGCLLKEWPRFRLRAKGPIFLLLSYLAISVLSYFPHYIPYFNEYVWDRKQIYKILADSSVEFGQDNWYVQQHMKQNPGTIAAPPEPTAGRIVVSINEMVRRREHVYKWLFENFEPVDHVAYSHLVFEVSPQDLAKITAREAGVVK